MMRKQNFCIHFGNQNFYRIFASNKNSVTMVIISSREFRANQGKYLGMAVNGKSVVLHSRSHGSFKLVPISGDDAVMTEEEFSHRINEGLRQIQEGKSTTVKGKQELNAFLDSL